MGVFPKFSSLSLSEIIVWKAKTELTDVICIKKKLLVQNCSKIHLSFEYKAEHNLLKEYQSLNQIHPDFLTFSPSINLSGIRPKQISSAVLHSHLCTNFPPKLQADFITSGEDMQFLHSLDEISTF